MRRKSFNLVGHTHFLTFSCYKRYQIFTDASACRLLAESLHEARLRLRFALWSYVFMPDHVHLLLMPGEDKYSMATILKQIKGPFGKWLVEDWKARHPHLLRRHAVASGSGTVFRVWERGGGFDRNLYTREHICRAVEYIEANPVRKGLVVNPVDWLWSSARARAGVEDVPIHIDAISWDEVELQQTVDHSQKRGSDL